MIPNVLLIICDDRGRYLGCRGIETVRSPNLGALAADWVPFNEHGVRHLRQEPGSVDVDLVQGLSTAFHKYRDHSVER